MKILMLLVQIHKGEKIPDEITYNVITTVPPIFDNEMNRVLLTDQNDCVAVLESYVEGADAFMEMLKLMVQRIKSHQKGNENYFILSVTFFW